MANKAGDKAGNKGALGRWCNRLVGGGCLALLLSGCASMSQQECLVADWRLVGYEDASQGHSTTRIGEHRKACAKANVQPDLNRYQQGHREGARVYCVKPRGYQEGAAGKAYQGICPADLEPAFLRAYDHGRERHAITQQISQLEGSISSSKLDIGRYQDDIAEHEKAIVDGKSSSKERRQHLRDMEQLRQQIAAAEIAISHAQRSIDELHYELQRLEQQHQRLGYSL